MRSVARALTLLEVFSHAGASHSVASLARRAGLPRTTALRMVDTLVEEGMLLIGEDGNVRVGTRLIGWGALAEAAWTVPPATLERMRHIADATGETVSIYIRSGLQRTVIAQAPSRHNLRHAVQVGDQLPLWGGAAALVLLGLEADAARGRLIADVVALSDGRTTVDRLSDEVAEASARGSAVSHGGRESGNSGLAIPLVAGRGAARRPQMPVALALGGPTIRFAEDRIDLFRRELVEAAPDLLEGGLPAALY